MNTKTDDARRDFIARAADCGVKEAAAASAYEILAPWVRNRALTTETRLYEDLGMVDEDLEETVFGLWQSVFKRPILKEEAAGFPVPKTVADLLLHISGHL